MILAWFDARQAEEFGASLAVFFTERIPRNQQIEEKKIAAKAQKTLGQMADQVARFKLQNKLNTYKKARLGNAFKWALRDAGLDPSQVDQLTKWLMLQIS
jgi:hypothetical protein